MELIVVDLGRVLVEMACRLQSCVCVFGVCLPHGGVSSRKKQAGDSICFCDLSQIAADLGGVSPEGIFLTESLFRQGGPCYKVPQMRRSLTAEWIVSTAAGTRETGISLYAPYFFPQQLIYFWGFGERGCVWTEQRKHLI